MAWLGPNILSPSKLRIGFLVSGLSNWRDGDLLSSLLINKYLSEMDTLVVIITGKCISYHFRVVVAQYWICS